MKKTIELLTINIALLLLLIASFSALSSLSMSKYISTKTSSSSAVRIAKYNITFQKNDTWSDGMIDNVLLDSGAKTYSFTVKNKGEVAAQVRVVTVSGTVTSSKTGWFTMPKNSTENVTISVNAPTGSDTLTSASFYFEHEQVN